ncbi:MAG: DUF4159 domain-containing protein [Ignavibacteriae bacterium]|nr:DUF4159 domain-containing protein [Ignavibacteriota bacterium]MCB9207742.1 DUF4159 domain-containing protein [Ignavibacteriales bacterium]MCB9258512.1 DUF4159 domain-containing protein [Ignavibacteriales bacterium]
MKLKFLLIFIIFCEFTYSQVNPNLQIGRIKYSGGGDWYNDPSAEVNLLNFISENTNIKTNPNYVSVDLETNELFNYPITFLTGHGNIVLSEKNIRTLREYFENGGFMIVDDDYGLDNSFRREISKVFPNSNLIELPFDHEIYHSIYDFNNGPPKTHEHDNKPPRGYGLFLGDRMIIYYTVESNPSDGWANQDVHNDPEEKRIEALKFGTNIIVYALSN